MYTDAFPMQKYTNFHSTLSWACGETRIHSHCMNTHTQTEHSLAHSYSWAQAHHTCIYAQTHIHTRTHIHILEVGPLHVARSIISERNTEDKNKGQRPALLFLFPSHYLTPHLSSTDYGQESMCATYRRVKKGATMATMTSFFQCPCPAQGAQTHLPAPAGSWSWTLSQWRLYLIHEKSPPRSHPEWCYRGQLA